MARGYMGQYLDVDLSAGTISVVPLDEALCRDYIGGYGVGARLLYDRIPAQADPLGPENVLGFLTGPLTGTRCIEGNRSVVVCKSPLTNTWGDANCGGTFGPHLKFAGFDHIFFSGQADHPVYLVVDNGKADLRDASELWGMTCDVLEDTLKAKHGKDVQIASIGPAGERLSLISCIINDKGRAWGRSGVGAVMGSKNLKAIVVKGKQDVPVVDDDTMRAVRSQYLKVTGGLHDVLVDHGTVGIAGDSALSGDSPIKNWGGVGEEDYAIGKKIFDPDHFIQTYQTKKYGCWRCTMACGGHVEVKEDGIYLGIKDHKPEYESVAAFGGMTLVDNVPALIKANYLCNIYGLDNISAGVTMAFAIECFENELITERDTGGIPLNWGDHEAMNTMLEMLARREGFGDVLADGVQRAAQRIGKGSEQYAMHVKGQEVPMHDPKLAPALATTYLMDATPARHTQGNEGMFGINQKVPKFAEDDARGRAEVHNLGVAWCHVVNAAGICLFGYVSYDYRYLPESLAACTGWSWSDDEIVQAGERIAIMRHAFNLREGLNPLTFAVPGRIIGNPPQASGPLAGVTVDVLAQAKAYCAAAGLDPETTIPAKDKLAALGMDFLLRELYPA